jgi:hypothetical protein
MTQRSAAGQIWPHLPSDEPPKQQQRASSLSAAMYPSLTPQAKAQNELREQRRQNLLQGLREARMKITGGR